ncbi:MAG: NAD(+) diphosphatase [Hyphomonadaceae bacterium]|nr:NAD(+) diphosphatase [Hyphomonadaceae bacterium]
MLVVLHKGPALSPHNPNAFARYPLDRAGHRRSDQAWLDAAMGDDTQNVVIPFYQGKPLITENGPLYHARALATHIYHELGRPDSPLIFLGIDGNGDAYFACEIADPATLETLGQFMDLRMAGMRMDARELPIVGCAKAVLEWHENNRFCAKCGTPSDVAEAGWKRVCPNCRREHFPRVDPVVIMLPVLGERVLLGRQRMFPRGMYSALAGFVEPGETIEEAAARETLEEAGLVVTRVHAHSTQPWPFPHSLMIGAICEVEADTLKVDEHELETARWFTRDEARLLIEGKHPDCFAPPPFAIAHHLLKSWAEEG